MKTMTWSELKDFIDKIDPQFMGEEIIWWGENNRGTINSALILEEDYTGISGDYMEPTSTYIESFQFSQEDLEGDGTIVKKDTPVIYLN